MKSSSSSSTFFSYLTSLTSTFFSAAFFFLSSSYCFELIITAPSNSQSLTTLLLQFAFSSAFDDSRLSSYAFYYAFVFFFCFYFCSFFQLFFRSFFSTLIFFQISSIFSQFIPLYKHKINSSINTVIDSSSKTSSAPTLSHKRSATALANQSKSLSFFNTLPPVKLTDLFVLFYYYQFYYVNPSIAQSILEDIYFGIFIGIALLSIICITGSFILMFALIIVSIIVGQARWVKLGVGGRTGGWIRLGWIFIRRLITSCRRLLISLTFLQFITNQQYMVHYKCIDIGYQMIGYCQGWHKNKNSLFFKNCIKFNFKIGFRLKIKLLKLIKQQDRLHIDSYNKINKKMGQQTSKSTFQQKNWQTLSSAPGKKILFNTSNNRSVQKHESMIDCDQKQIIEVCKWRQHLKQQDHVVQMYQYGVKKPGLCNGLPLVYVVTERLALFQDIGGFTVAEGMLLLREVVTGFKVLFGRFGYFNPCSTIIGINSQGKAKVWSNQNFALYEPLRSPSSIQTPSSQLTITNRLVSLLQSKTLPTSKYPYPVSYPKNLDIESLLQYLNNLLSTLPMQYQIDKIYLDRAEFQKKYIQIQEKARQDQLSKTKGVDVERRMREVGQLEAGIRQQQMQLEQKQLYIRMIERQRQEEAIRLQAEMLRIQQQQNRKQQELMMLHHLEKQRQQQFQLQQQQHQLSRQKSIQLQRQQQIQYQRQQQFQLIKQQQLQAQRQQFKKQQYNQVPYYAHPTDMQMMHQQPQIQYQQLQPQYHLQQPTVANPNQLKTMKGTTSTVQSQNKPTRIQYPPKQPPMPPTTHQRSPSAIIQQALQQMPVEQKISRKNSYESYRSYNSNGSKIKKEIEMVDSMILMQDDEMSDQQNKRYIESRIIQYPIHPA